MDKSTKVKIVLGGLILLAAGNFFVWKEVFGLNGKLEVVFFDVGQGDSIFVETPQGHQVLIDGGPSGGVVLEKLSKAMPFWDRTLDLVVLTHSDYDHLRGLVDVLERYQIENILWTGALDDTKTFENWLLALEKERARVFLAQDGEVVKAGQARFYVLYPLENIEGILPKNNNEGSVVLRLLFGENSFLFAGDISKKVEKEILQASENIACDVLKVPHHGSYYANSGEFLRQTSAKIAVISCGKDNKYGHPHPEVLSSLEKFGINILRTDEKGDIKITASGSDFKVNY